jgi:hypothetical protein
MRRRLRFGARFANSGAMMFPYGRRVSVLASLLAVAPACVAGDDDDDLAEVTQVTQESHGQGTPVGLSLWWQDGEVRLFSGAAKTVDLYEDYPRFLQELDITAQVVTPTDEGIAPLLTTGDMASLDWHGVHQTDEDWRPDGNTPPTYTRTRIFRGARWMNRQSIVTLIPVDDRGRIAGIPIIELTGRDDDLASSDGGFVRRFVARQVAQGCQAIGDCSNVTSFTAQGLAQLRDSLHPTQRAQRIPRRATKLQLFWTEDLFRLREVAIRHRDYDETPYRYGFTPQVEIVTPPANGQFYAPGEGFDFRITYRDGAGNRLHEAGSLPAYAEFTGDQIDSGIRYYDGFRQVLTIYYALKHREGNNIWSFSGPTSEYKASGHVVPLGDFFALAFTQIPMATVAEDGYTSVFNLVPNPAYELDPFLSTQRPSDLVHVTVPADAEPGTYLLSFKGRRDWGGEATIEAVTQEVQVGQVAPTVFVPKTGNCNGCHTGQGSFEKVLHGIGDRRTCFGCHAPLAMEPDHRLDFRVHFIHTRSNRFPADANDCSTCHLTPPTGPARGFPGVDALP